MYFDNLTIVGLAAISLYGLLPLAFGREFLWVKEEMGQGAVPSHSSAKHEGPHPAATGLCPEPCEES
ncbi:MAG: hypothetical protein WCA32_03965 [Chromatiaceae bacterium]|jgi:hypothetical protein